MPNVLREYVVLRVVCLAILVTLDLGNLIFPCKFKMTKIWLAFREYVVLKLSVDLPDW